MTVCIDTGLFGEKEGVEIIIESRSDCSDPLTIRCSLFLILQKGESL